MTRGAMRMFKSETWSYVVLLLILFALASVSVSQVLVHLHDLLIDPDKEFPAIAALIMLLTMGFMFLAGAFGLWTIQFVTEKEAQRRLTQLVDAMDHLQDGMLLVNRAGRIAAMNASARKLVLSRDDDDTFPAAFPGLSEATVARLLNGEEAVEIEEAISCDLAPPRTLRFRSQPVGTFHVVMVSDVTSINLQRQHSRVKARLQLLGELAKGVAHDFNSLLIDISGYASLLARVPRTAPEYDQAVRAIVRDAERGSALAEQILALANQGTTGTPTDLVMEHARTASEDLAAVLPLEWQVSFSGEGKFPVVALSGLQIEQIVMNLGLLVAENRRHHGTVSIVLTQLSSGSPGPFAGNLLVHGAASIHDILDHTSPTQPSTTTGVIQSVIRNIVEDAGGRMDTAMTANSVPYFRIWLPYGNVTATSSLPSLPPDQSHAIAAWQVLLACDSKPQLHQRLDQLGATVHAVRDIVSAIAFIEQEHDLDAMVFDRHLLRPETHGLLRAIRKLRPGCGIVVLAEADDTEQDLPEGIVCVSRQHLPDAILTRLLRARQSAMGIAPPDRSLPHPTGEAPS